MAITLSSRIVEWSYTGCIFSYTYALCGNGGFTRFTLISSSCFVGAFSFLESFFTSCVESLVVESLVVWCCFALAFLGVAFVDLGASSLVSCGVGGEY